MMVELPRRLGSILVALLALSGAAASQSPACNAWRGELASLQGQRGGGDPRAADAARRVAGELSQTVGQYRAIGCERGFSIFGDGAPRQCGGLRAQIDQLQAQYGALQRQAQGGGFEQRRAQLASLIDNNCRAAPQQRGFFETIFGIDPRREQMDPSMPELEAQPPIDDKPRLGGSYAVCVRSCDGFFFPLANSPGGRESQDDMCQALCPGAETSAFSMSSGGDIQNAMSRSGVPYSSLPNAGKYQRSFDAACTCRGQGQSWAQALKDAEQLLDRRKGDIIVTEQRAAELSRPRADTRADARRKAATPAPVPAAAATATDADEKPLTSENSPTSGNESAGMGPQNVEGEKVLQKGDGLKRQTKSVTGESRTVRIVAPNLAPNINQENMLRP